MALVAPKITSFLPQTCDAILAIQPASLVRSSQATAPAAPIPDSLWGYSTDHVARASTPTTKATDTADSVT